MQWEVTDGKVSEQDGHTDMERTGMKTVIKLSLIHIWAVKGSLFFLQLWNGKIITLYTVYIKYRYGISA